MYKLIYKKKFETGVNVWQFNNLQDARKKYDYILFEIIVYFHTESENLILQEYRDGKWYTLISSNC